MRRKEEPMEEQNSVNEEEDSNTQRQETEEVAGREKVGEQLGRLGNQGEIATKPKPVEVRDTQEREGHRRLTKEKNRKYFHVLQEDTELLRKEEESPQIVKTNKDEKKIYEGKGRCRIKKRREKVKQDPTQDYQKTTPNKGSQNENSIMLRCKSA